VLDSSGAAGGSGFRRRQSSDMKATCPEHVTNGSRNSWLSSVELRNLKPNVRAVLSPNLLWRQAGNQHCQPGAENLPVAHLPQQVGVPRQFIAELIRGRGMDHLTADPQRAAQPARRDPSLMHYKCPSTQGSGVSCTSQR
jgi:hypothetical protein